MHDKTLQILNQRPDVAELHLLHTADARLPQDAQDLLRIYQPGNCLVIYGSLAPGRSNHHEVAYIQGEWFPATIYGSLINKGWAAGSGFPAFSPALPETGEVTGVKHTAKGIEPTKDGTGPEPNETIEAWVLISAQLPEHWQALDEFEGEDYRRILVEYQLANSETGVGYVYAANL